jgi:UDP-glucose 4-epimerase
MRAVVTGGAGFIGSNLVDALLARGDEVTVVDNLATGKRENLSPDARLLESDIRDEALSLEADVVFHLAAQADVNTSVQRPLYDADVNVRGTVNVLEAARRSGAQVVFSSTGGAIYGDVERPAPETDERRPVSPYGIAKLAGEEYLLGWNRIHGSRHSVLRFANVYGPRQDSGLEGGVVAIFLERMAAGQPTAIYGDGGQTRDFVYVGDVVDALLAVAAAPGGPYNVGTGEETSVTQLHELCRAVSAAEQLPGYEEARLGDARRSVLDVSLIERELGWRPRVSLEDGLRQTWAWMTTQSR